MHKQLGHEAQLDEATAELLAGASVEIEAPTRMTSALQMKLCQIFTMTHFMEATCCFE